MRGVRGQGKPEEGGVAGWIFAQGHFGRASGKVTITGVVQAKKKKKWMKV